MIQSRHIAYKARKRVLGLFLSDVRPLRRGFSTKPQPESSTQANISLSNKQRLFMTDPVSPGSIFFLPHGTRLFNKLVSFMKNQQARYGFEEIITPLIYKTQLWEQSGHWENYKDDMFKVQGFNKSREEDESGLHEYGLKPMNCPGHCIVYSQFDRSYQDLPVRFSDFSSLHRNEASGALSGLTRVRRFHQDDGHIFCTMDQINHEIANTIKLIKDTYRVFGVTEKNDITYFLSTRPEQYLGDVSTWERAESQLKELLDKSVGSEKWSIREGDGAFYGPKIDVLLQDAFGKKHQVGTVQLDFQLPSRFDLKFVSNDGSRSNRPIMIHRAIFGSLERFIAILMDHYQGKWPFWINPRQAMIIPVNESHVEAAKKLQKQLQGDILNEDVQISPITGYNFYVDIDDRNETVGNRIKDAIQKSYSYILMIGDKDIEKGTVAIRSRDNRKIENLTPTEIYEKFIKLEKAFQ